MRIVLAILAVSSIACVPCTEHAPCEDCIEAGCLWIERVDDAGSTSSSCVSTDARDASESEGWTGYDDVDACEGAALHG